MSLDYLENLLPYYKKELSYLRSQGAEFAQKYPKVAECLEFNSQPSTDPHLERLLESFAFLTGRIQHKINQEFPEIINGLFQNLFPQLLNQIPSMTILEFRPEEEKSEIPLGYKIPKNSLFSATTDDNIKCHFTTAYPVNIWPLKIEHADFEATTKYSFLDKASDAATTIRVSVSLENKCSPDQLRFYLSGDPVNAFALYDMLLCNTSHLIMIPDGNEEDYFEMDKDSIKPVGYSKEHSILPYPENAQPGYRILMEYFTFPEKFLFFDLTEIDLRKCQKSFELIFVLDQLPKKKIDITPATFKLNCSPAINLFKKTADPLSINHQETEYRICGDSAHETTTEVHSVLEVEISSKNNDQPESVEPFFSFQHHMRKNQNQLYWSIRKTTAKNSKLNGMDTYLSFLKVDSSVKIPETETLLVTTLCTNRSLAEKMVKGTKLIPGGKISNIEAVCLQKPTSSCYPSLDGENHWKLISQLSLNYLSLSSDSESLNALKEILHLYNFKQDSSTHQQIQGMLEMTTKTVVRRVGKEAWRGFCKGTEVSLLLGDSFYEGASAYLFASVLDSFFRNYTSVNSFIQTVVYLNKKEKIWKRWDAKIGEKQMF